MRFVPIFGFIGLVIGLGGVACSEAPESSLQNWMSEQRGNLKPRSETVSVPVKFNPQVYNYEGIVEPFASQKLLMGLRSDSASSVSESSLITTEKNRRKSDLESFPLDAMNFVGTIQRDRVSVAVIRIDKRMYTVAVGEYLGTNYGKILGIGDSEIRMREVVQDAAGEWIERAQSLKLQGDK